MEFVHTAQGTYSMGGPPDVTPETPEEIFKKALPIRSASDGTGEFFHFQPGAEPGHYKNGLTVAQQCQLEANRNQKNMPPSMLAHDERAPKHWPSSMKLRSFESVHMPEMKGWHRRAQGLPTDPKTGGPPSNYSIWKQPKVPTHARRPRGDRGMLFDAPSRLCCALLSLPPVLLCVLPCVLWHLRSRMQQLALFVDPSAYMLLCVWRMLLRRAASCRAPSFHQSLRPGPCCVPRS